MTSPADDRINGPTERRVHAQSRKFLISRSGMTKDLHAFWYSVILLKDSLGRLTCTLSSPAEPIVSFRHHRTCRTSLLRGAASGVTNYFGTQLNGPLLVRLQRPARGLAGIEYFNAIGDDAELGVKRDNCLVGWNDRLLGQYIANTAKQHSQNHNQDTHANPPPCRSRILLQFHDNQRAQPLLLSRSLTGLD